MELCAAAVLLILLSVVVVASYDIFVIILLIYDLSFVSPLFFYCCCLFVCLIFLLLQNTKLGHSIYGSLNDWTRALLCWSFKYLLMVCVPRWQCQFLYCTFVELKFMNNIMLLTICFVLFYFFFRFSLVAKCMQTHTHREHVKLAIRTG